MLRLAATVTGLSIIGLTVFAQTAGQSAPPVAKIEPTEFTAHGHHRVDDYQWLRDKTNPAVISYLNAENDYASNRLAPLQPLIAELESELRQRADHAESFPLFADNRYIYRRRITQGATFPLIVRHPLHDAAEQVVLDVAQLAAGHSNYELADYVISPDGNSVAYAADLSGRRIHQIFIRDISTGKIIETGIREAASELAFSADSKWLFYVRVHPEAIRSYQVWRHQIGSASQDQIVYEEVDPTFELHLNRSKSGKYILLNSTQQQTSEVRYLPTAQPTATPVVMEARRYGVIYNADHVDGTFYIRTNLQAPDFRLVRAPQDHPQAEYWTELVAQTPGRLISEFDVYNSFVALVEEADAIQSVRVLRFSDQRMMSVPVPNSIGVTEIVPSIRGVEQDAAATTLRVRFSGPLHPPSTFDFNTLTGEAMPNRRATAVSWFDASAYEVRRIGAVAADGESVPVTLTFRKDQQRPGGNPVLLTGYGAYGSSEEPTFPDYWMSLIDRGFILAQAHVRGGQEKGRRWYEQGHMLAKNNSFEDFIAATEALIVQGYADPRRIFARGASAGGLLVAVAVNRRPDLYAGVVAEVPFVDVVTTMSDPDIPLTTLEYEEWGNPGIKQHFDTMLSYSPYDNVTAQSYPPMLVTAALNDSQVGFHEPAKWVARLRATKTDNNELLFITSMDSGHSGKPGRFGSDKQNARIMAWLIFQSVMLLQNQ